MSNMMNVAATIVNIMNEVNELNDMNSVKTNPIIDTECLSNVSTMSLSSNDSISDILNDSEYDRPLVNLEEKTIYNNQEFQVKYEGKYVDFIPYKTSFRLIKVPICRYENIPERVFGKIEINDKYNSVTVIYKTFKKKHIKIKK